MLKKVIIGILCFVILAATAGGIYLYTLDWNKHKAVVAQRFSQITGLKAVIDGNLEVKLFPSPEFSASKVKFFKNNGGKSPLVVVNEIRASVDLMPLLDNNFIVKSMTLTDATAYVEIDEKGVLNWDGVGQNSNTKSGNVEVSFNDVRVNKSTLSYKNLEDKNEFEIHNVSANISAPSLKGPYKTSGKFIHNNSEVQFKGDIIKDSSLTLKMALNNISSGTSATIEGTLGAKAKGNVTFDTQSLLDVSNVVFGNASISEWYNKPLYFSFQYDYEKGMAKLDNFTAKYDKNTAGSGTVIIKNNQDRTDINADFDMAKFDLGILEGLSKDIIAQNKGGKKFADSAFAGYNLNLSVKAGTAWYNNVEAQNLSLGVTLQDNVIDIMRFGVIMPGDTTIKTVGRINLNNGVDYIFNQAADSKDLRTFVSVFGIDLAKLAAAENKKSIFKRAQAEIKINGNLDSLKISFPRAVIDSTALRGNIGFVKKEKVYVLADIDTSKIIFDRYLQAVPEQLKQASVQDKFIYQMNLIPWNRDLDVDAEVNIASAVYNDIPLEKIYLHINTNQEHMDVKKFSVDNIAGASLSLSMNTDKIFSAPYFNELSYDIKTDNFPLFASTLGIDTGSKNLFKRKIFAAQGAMSGTLSEFSLSSVQKFGDTEFSYTGVVANNSKEGAAVNGDWEMKTNNFSSFIKALNIDYTPDMPVTTFTLASKIKGNADLFALDGIKAYLGANAISGNLQFDNTAAKPKLAAEINFDKFEADRWFNLAKKASAQAAKNNQATFIAEPAWNSKIDYSRLGKIDFDIKATAKQLSCNGKNYTSAATEMQLKDSILNVVSFDASQDKSHVNLRFILDSNGIAKVNGYFNVKNLKTPEFGGSVYALESGWLTAEGTFNSLAGSQKEFFDNLNSKGKFSLANTAVRGWDLDIIKFEFEQRKSVSGFENSVLNSLKSGKSSFSKIRGTYNISKGLAVAESVIWESPVVNMNMKFDLNLSDWLFTAVFNAVYHNASFSDIFKFTFGGNLANPTVKTDLSETIKRISELEDRIKNARHYKEKEKMERIGGKLKSLQRAVDGALQDINRLTLEVVRFKPVTQNDNVVNVYEENLKTIRNAEISIKKMKDMLNNYPEEETLMSIEADLGAEKAKLKFIPKVLEENFIVDSKYIFDDTFNKIAWMYNLAQNNSAYHTGLTDVYMAQIELLKTSENPIAEDKIQELQAGINKTKEVMDNIGGLHAKIRDNYLNIIDSSKISEMKENNEIATQALKTMLTYTKQLNEDIIANIDLFRAVLGINARDYDEYMVYPPETIEEIDVTKPTVKTGGGTVPSSASGSSDLRSAEPEETPSPQEKAPDGAAKQQKELSSSQAGQPASESVQKANTGHPDVSNTITNNETMPDSNSKTALPSITDEIKNKDTQAKSESAEANNPLSSSQASQRQKAYNMVLTETSGGLFNLFNKIEDEKASRQTIETASTAEFGGLSQILKSNAPQFSVKTLPDVPALTPAITVSAAPTPSPKDAGENILTKTKAAISKIMAKLQQAEKDLEKNVMAYNDISAADTTSAKVNKKEDITQAKTAKTTIAEKESKENLIAGIKHSGKKKIEAAAANIKLSDKKDAETTVTDIKLSGKKDIKTAAADIKITEEKASAAETKSSMKINPVVALNIGKKDSSQPVLTISDSIGKRQKFAFNKKQNNKQQAFKTADATQNKDFAPSARQQKSASQVQPDFKIPSPASSSDFSPVQNAEKRNTSILQHLFAENDITFAPFAGEHITDDALVAVETSFEPVKKQNLYVFSVRSPYVKEASGIAGKSMLKGKFSGQPQNLNLKKHYLYAANTQGKNVFSGTISKRNSVTDM